MVIATDTLTINGWLADLHAKKITRTQFDARIAAVAYERSGGSKMEEQKVVKQLNGLAKAEINGEKKNKSKPGIPQKVKGNGTLSLKVHKPTKAQVKRIAAGILLDKLGAKGSKVTKATIKKVAVKLPKGDSRNCPHCGKIVARGQRCPDRNRQGHKEGKTQ